jgi:L-iditol 2-dehydrogenase
MSGGWGADVVIVACSSRSAQEQALTLVRRGGRINLFAGLPTGAPPLPVDTNYLHYNEVAIVATHGSTPADNAEALRLLQSGQLRVDDLITHVEPLTSIRQAFRKAEEADTLKVVVQPWAEGTGSTE